MAQTENVRQLANFIWSVADLLRGDYKQADYGKVIGHSAFYRIAAVGLRFRAYERDCHGLLRTKSEAHDGSRR